MPKPAPKSRKRKASKPRPKAINQREMAAVRHFLTHGNMAEAYVAAGYSKKGANKNAPRLFARPHVKEYLDRLRAQAAAVQDVQAVGTLTEARETLTMIMRDAVTARNDWANLPDDERKKQVSPIILSAKAVVSAIDQLAELGTFENAAKGEGLDLAAIRNKPLQVQIALLGNIARAGGPSAVTPESARIYDIPLLDKKVG